MDIEKIVNNKQVNMETSHFPSLGKWCLWRWTGGTNYFESTIIFNKYLYQSWGSVPAHFKLVISGIGSQGCAPISLFYRLLTTEDTEKLKIKSWKLKIWMSVFNQGERWRYLRGAMKIPSFGDEDVFDGRWRYLHRKTLLYCLDDPCDTLCPLW